MLVKVGCTHYQRMRISIIRNNWGEMIRSMCRKYVVSVGENPETGKYTGIENQREKYTLLKKNSEKPKGLRVKEILSV